MTLRTLNYGNYGIFLIKGNAGFCPSAVLLAPALQRAEVDPALNYCYLSRVYDIGFRV